FADHSCILFRPFPAACISDTISLNKDSLLRGNVETFRNTGKALSIPSLPEPASTLPRYNCSRIERPPVDLNQLKDAPPWEWPEGAGRALINVLRDRRGRASDRTLAADLAGNLTVMDDRLADVLLALVRSPEEPEKLRAQAAISLGPALEEADLEG